MATYIYDRTKGCLVDKATGEPMPKDPNWVPAVPYITTDIQGYRSRVSGKWIDGRAAQRDDLARTGCRLLDPSECPVKEDVARLYDQRLKQKLPKDMIA